MSSPKYREGEPDELGVPYAPFQLSHYQATGEFARRCPVCGQLSVEEIDEEGELTTNNYGKHYKEVHG